MSKLSKEERETLERLKKESAALRKGLPRPSADGALPGKFSDFAPGLDDQGKPFPLQPAAPAKPKK